MTVSAECSLPVLSLLWSFEVGWLLRVMLSALAWVYVVRDEGKIGVKINVTVPFFGPYFSVFRFCSQASNASNSNSIKLRSASRARCL